MITTENIKQLRDETGAGVMDAKKALEASNGDFEEAKKYLLKHSLDKAMKKSDRDASDGLVASYIHTGSKVGSMVMLACETDFVAKTEDFQKLANEIAKQVCAVKYETIEEVLKDNYIRDQAMTINDLINQAIAKMGEKIELLKFTRFSIKE